MHDLRRGHRPRQVGLEHIAAIEPGRVTLGGLGQPQPQRAALCLDTQPLLHGQARELCLHLAEGYRDLRPGMGVQIGIFLANELLYRVLFVSASGGDLRGPLGIAAQDRAATSRRRRGR